MAEQYNYLSYALHDSIYPNGQIKEDVTSKTNTDEDDRGTALNFFRVVDCIDKFICRREADVSHDMIVCSVCSDQLIRMIEKTYKSSQEQARSYSVTIHEYQTEHPDYLTTIKINDSHGRHIKNDALATLSSQQSDECEIDLLRHIQDIEEQRSKTMSEMEAELVLFASVEAETLSLDAEIDSALNHSDRASREINYLNSEHGSICVLFDLSITSRPLSSSGTPVSGSELELDMNNTEIVVVINGMRLMYLPSTSDNLNWAEINRAWSCLSLLVCCLRNRRGLPEKTVLLIEGGSIAGTGESARTCITLQLRPLRRRTVILLSLDHFQHQSQEHSTTEDVLFLCGEGSSERFTTSDREAYREEVEGDDSDYMDSDDFSASFSNQDLYTEQHRRYQYYQAVIALAAVVCATARDLGRVDCLTDSMHCLDLSPLLDICSFHSSQSKRAEHGGDLVGQMCHSLRNLTTDP